MVKMKEMRGWLLVATCLTGWVLIGCTPPGRMSVENTFPATATVEMSTSTPTVEEIVSSNEDRYSLTALHKRMVDQLDADKTQDLCGRMDKKYSEHHVFRYDNLSGDTTTIKLLSLLEKAQMRQQMREVLETVKELEAAHPDINILGADATGWLAWADEQDRQ